MEPLIVAPGVTVPIEAMSWHAVRSGGPGGQNVNKVASKIELRILVDRVVGLSGAQRARLDRSITAAVNADGIWIVTSQRTRSQLQNLEDAREKVRMAIASALPAPKRRIKTRPSRAARQRRLNEKQQASQKKQERRWRGGD